jgi:UrcA family protein
MKSIAFAQAWAAIVSGAMIAPSAAIAETLTASRIVSVTSADLKTSESIGRLRKKLRIVSRLVCDQQYPGESVYILSHPCYADTFNDASHQLDEIIAHNPAALALALITVSGR